MVDWTPLQSTSIVLVIDREKDKNRTQFVLSDFNFKVQKRHHLSESKNQLEKNIESIFGCCHFRNQQFNSIIDKRSKD